MLCCGVTLIMLAVARFFPSFSLQGVVALLTPDSVDVLSHSAVRARNSGVVMAACFDSDALAAVQQLSGRHVDVNVLQAWLTALPSPMLLSLPVE